MIELIKHSRTVYTISKKSGKKLSTSYWLGKCSECGTIKEFRKSNVTYGRSKKMTCGCYIRQDRIYRGTDSAKVQFFNGMIENCKNRGHIMSLTLQRVIQLAEANCIYCDMPPKMKTSTRHSRIGLYPNWIRNGIDRLDSTLGYQEGNVVTCCRYCNLMKNKFSKEEFLLHVKRVYEHNKERGNI